MKICCFPHCAYLSETSRMIAVYKELENKGVEVIMATHGGQYEELLKTEKIPYFIVEPYMDTKRAQLFVATNRGEKGRKGFYETDELREHVQSEIAFFKKHKIDKILSGFTLSCVISARVAKVKLAVTHLGSYVPSIFEYKLLPGFMMLDNWLLRLIPNQWKINFVNWFIPRTKLWTKEFNIIAKEVGIKPFKSMQEVMMGDTIIATDVPEILGIPEEDMNRCQPAYKKLYNYSFIIKYGGAIYAKFFGEVPEDVREFLETDKKKVYVAMTSSRIDYIKRVYESLMELDNLRVVFCSTVHELNLEEKPHILIKKYLPSHKLMPLTDLAIIHGGQGSVQTAISSGTPIIGFPLHVEQALNVALMEKHGAGKMLRISQVDKVMLQETMIEILQDSSYKRNMATLKDYQDRVDGPKRVADLMIEM